jgi:twinkle protein
MNADDNDNNKTVSTHQPCGDCGDRALATYSDGGTYCHSCNKYHPPSAASRAVKISHSATPRSFLPVSYADLPKRNIRIDTCRKYQYGVCDDLQVAQYFDASGNLAAQHTRDAQKNFKWIGDVGKVQLFGQKLFPSTGRRIFITEGEIDCLSLAQVLETWPVVSVPNGAASAKRYLAKELDWLEGFSEVVLCFDSDKAGQDAARACSELFSPGKCKIATLPLKDANEMLLAGHVRELTEAVLFNARVVRPDGIIAGDDPKIHDYVVSFEAHADAHYPWPLLDQRIYGMRRGELVTHTAGTGIGKSTVCREIAYALGVGQGQRVGIASLEESVGRYGLFLASIHANQRLHLHGGLAPEIREKLFRETIGNGNYFLYDHFGSLAAGNLLSRLRYFAKALDCHWIILDHISIAVSGSETDDERRTIDALMTNLRSLVEETGVGMHVVSHLSRRHDGKSHEEGAQISLRDLRGSHSIVQLSDIVLGYERNQQDAKGERNVIRVRRLKDRYSGETGLLSELVYDDDTGRLRENGDFVIMEEQTSVANEDANAPF